MPSALVIQSLWIGDPLSKLEQLCIQSFLHNGHPFHLYTYAEVGDIPAGAVVKDASAILPSECIFRDDHGSVAGFSDWFRYALLAARGGFYVDMDTICIQPFNFAEGLIFGLERPGHAATCVIGALGGRNDVLLRMRDACADFPKIMPWDSGKTRLRKLRRRITKRGREGARYGSVGGPLPFTDALRYFDILKHGQAPEVFCPVVAPDWRRIFDQTFAGGISFGRATHALQFWNSRFAEQPGFDKNAQFPRDSLIEQLKRKYGGE